MRSQKNPKRVFGLGPIRGDKWVQTCFMYPNMLGSGRAPEPEHAGGVRVLAFHQGC